MKTALILFLKRKVVSIIILVLSAQWVTAQHVDLAILPQPKEISFKGAPFKLNGRVNIVAGNDAEDKFAAEDLAEFIRRELGVEAVVSARSGGASIALKRAGKDKTLGTEGYRVSVSAEKFEIAAPGAAGLFYGVQTAKQLFRKNGAEVSVNGLEIRDWPDTKQRAAHYDTKHHQDTKEYVKRFIRELAGYKMNMLIWEWEDKFEYPSHPEIGAPGAFTMQEMQELTRYARRYHVQIVPLVQGLGHVGFILKWPQFAHLREIPASNFEFCPLKEGSYDLLMDLWKDAMEATPGSSFIHIGSDETYELGACEQCAIKVKEIGRSGLFHHFLGKSTRMLRPYGRGVMNWEAPMGWAKSRLSVYHGDQKETGFTVVPEKGMVLTESYDYETPDLKYAKEAKALGYPVYAYDPNPGIEMLFLPYFFSKNKDVKEPGALENSYKFLVHNLGRGVFDGVIRTSWDDSGLPMQAWMLCFATTAAYSWNVNGTSLQEFPSLFYRNRYGGQAAGVDSLYFMLNEAAYFYMESFERRVWHWGEIGKTHLPDLPRGDALEYDPFWNTEYADRLKEAEIYVEKMNAAIAICNRLIALSVNNVYDIEVFKTLCQLTRNTALTYLDLSQVEYAVRQAHRQRFVSYDTSFHYLQKAEQIVKNTLERRKTIFNELCAVWERTRLPKGMSTPDKQYFFEQERTRHFANRVPGMNYLIYDEEKLGLESYLEQLQEYMTFFSNRFLNRPKAN
ncbi:MAG: beta-N-acetylhexosaminidase [Chitinophagaceae bacterium]|nr:beta-N-acetylhexosaminidase [Chitinophagaceae bacterium]